jgi:hypothetical protein
MFFGCINKIWAVLSVMRFVPSSVIIVALGMPACDRQRSDGGAPANVDASPQPAQPGAASAAPAPAATAPAVSAMLLKTLDLPGSGDQVQ